MSDSTDEPEFGQKIETAGDLASLPIGVEVYLPEFGATVVNMGEFPYKEEWD